MGHAENIKNLKFCRINITLFINFVGSKHSVIIIEISRESNFQEIRKDNVEMSNKKGYNILLLKHHRFFTNISFRKVTRTLIFLRKLKKMRKNYLYIYISKKNKNYK